MFFLSFANKNFVFISKATGLVFLDNRAFASKASCRLVLLEKFILFITENIKNKLKY